MENAVAIVMHFFPCIRKKRVGNQLNPSSAASTQLVTLMGSSKCAL
jgi:hypothetical protein